jgi:hypothetical protein
MLEPSAAAILLHGPSSHHELFDTYDVQVEKLKVVEEATSLSFSSETMRQRSEVDTRQVVNLIHEERVASIINLT